MPEIVEGETGSSFHCIMVPSSECFSSFIQSLSNNHVIISFCSLMLPTKITAIKFQNSTHYSFVSVRNYIVLQNTRYLTYFFTF